MTSAHDKAILNSIFNPLLPVGDCVYDDNIPEELQDNCNADGSPQSKLISDLEIRGVKAAENGDIDGAMKAFEEAIQMNPKRPSCYNNRAQALRLLGKNDDAIRDLDLAIELSEGKGRSACQAFSQRGLIHRLKEEDDLAKEDFQLAANLGSQFAQTQLVQMNPYAALCNKMLHDVFNKLRKGEEY